MQAHEAARDTELSRVLLKRLRNYDGPPTTVMEVCGTHTVAVARLGLRTLLPNSVRLLSGPGCPVCVTPASTFDEAIQLVLEKNVVLTTYGDALRVPGSQGTLADAVAQGGDVRVVYSALDALDVAEREPRRQVVFLGLGFETTSPSVAHVVDVAKRRGVVNFSVLSAHKALLPAMEELARDPEIRIDAFLCPGHASMVLGTKAYEILSEKYGIPCVVAGFESNDILVGLLGILEQRKRSLSKVENTYLRAVSESGNQRALSLLNRVFVREDAEWRGLGIVSESGYVLSAEYEGYDARSLHLEALPRFGGDPSGCRCAEVLRGRIDPGECPLFGSACVPDSPVGACMVSSEGACGAHYRYGGVS